MYLPKIFHQQDHEKLLSIVQAYPFASLILNTPAGLEVNHIPMIYRETDGEMVLQGHIAKANPLWKSMPISSEGLAVFNGPNCYVSPNHYATKRDNGRAVPTWNYVAVHVTGDLRFVHDSYWNLAMLQALTLQHEAQQPEPWSINDAPSEYIDRMLPAIVGIELSNLRLVGKWKLSQNQPLQNQQGVVLGLAAESNSDAQKIAKLVSDLID